MQFIFKTWLMIALLLLKPQDLPGDQRSLKLAVMAAVVTNALAIQVLVDSHFLLLEATFDVMLAGLFLFMGFSLLGKPERFFQSFSAYCGASCVLNIMSLVLLGPAHMGQAANDVGGFARFLEFLFLVWNVAVLAHIIRYSFNIPLALGVSIAVFYLLLYLQLASVFLAI